MANESSSRKVLREIVPKATWYIEDLSAAIDSDALGELPANQRGHFACTSQRNQFTLIFDNGDMMLMQPGVTAHFKGVCQGEEAEDG